MTLRRYVVTVLLAVGLLQAAWIAVVPPFRGIDEIDHAYRAAAVGHGEWIAGGYADNGRGRLVTVPGALASAAEAQCKDLPYMGPENCSPAAEVGDSTVRIASSAGSYQPLSYAAVGWVTRLTAGSEAVMAMRVLTAALCLALIGAGTLCLYLCGLRASAFAGLLLSFTPVAIYSTSVVAPNGFELAAAYALWCAMLGLGAQRRTTRERTVLWIAGISAVILAGDRTLGPAFLLAIVGFSLAFGRTWWPTLCRHKKLVAWLAAAALVSAVSQVAWNRYQASLDLGVPKEFGEVSAAIVADAGRTWWINDSILLWPLQMIAAFPFRDQPAPPIVYALFAFVFVGFLALGLARARKRQRWVVLALMASTLLMPFVLTWMTYSSRGVIWQGRYGLPLGMGVPLMTCFLLNARRHRSTTLLLTLGAVLMSGVHSISLLRVLSDEERRPASVLHSGWAQPPSLLVIAMALVACGLLAHAAWRLGVPEDAPDISSAAGPSSRPS